MDTNSIQAWLSTYNESIGLYNAGIITTVFGGFLVAFGVTLIWPKLVELYGALGGLVGGGALIGTFWVLNHKLPGLGICPGCLPHPDDPDGIQQFGLMLQAFRGAGPWVDMGLAIGVGFWVISLLEAREKKDASTAGLVVESLPRLFCMLLGGAIGGAILGLNGFTGSVM